MKSDVAPAVVANALSFPAGGWRTTAVALMSQSLLKPTPQTSLSVNLLRSPGPLFRCLGLVSVAGGLKH